MNTTLLIVLGAAAVIILGYLVSVFNKIIVFNNKIKNAEDGITIQLEKIVNILKGVKIVKAGGKYEAGTFKDIINLRSGLINGVIADRLKTMDKIDEIIKTYFENPKLFEGMTFENYPGLKGTDLYSSFKGDYVRVIEELANEKKYYVGLVKDFNIFIQVFPNNVFAKLLGASTRESLNTDEEVTADMKSMTKEETDYSKELDEIDK